MPGLEVGLRRLIEGRRSRGSRSTSDSSGDTRGGSLPSSDAPPGSRRLTEGFFDAYPRFFDTSETSPQPWRLNLRYEAIFAENRDAFQGSRVLDIASHDGRWTIGALDTGASHVIGIEAKRELVDEARTNMDFYGVGREKYEFVTQDVFTELRTNRPQVDVVMCLGFFYHTLRYTELWSRMTQCSPNTILVDTEVYPHSQESLIRVTDEPVARQGNAVADEFSSDHTVVTGRPTTRAMQVMARAYGYGLTSTSDWAALLRDNPQAKGVGDYRQGSRVTMRFDRTRLP